MPVISEKQPATSASHRGHIFPTQQLNSRMVNAYQLASSHNCVSARITGAATMVWNKGWKGSNNGSDEVTRATKGIVSLELSTRSRACAYHYPLSFRYAYSHSLSYVPGGGRNRASYRSKVDKQPISCLFQVQTQERKTCSRNNLWVTIVHGTRCVAVVGDTKRDVLRR